MGSGNKPLYFFTRCKFVIKTMFVKGMGSHTTFSGWIHLQHTRKAVAFASWNFLLFLGLKTIKTSNRQIRQLYAYVAYESIIRVYLSVGTCELFLCFAPFVFLVSMVLTSLFSLFYVNCEFYRFLHSG